MLLLKEIRTKKGFTQEKLADLMQINRVTVAEYEANRMQPSIDKLIKMSIILDTDPNELLGYKKKYENYTEYLMSLKGD